MATPSAPIGTNLDVVNGGGPDMKDYLILLADDQPAFREEAKTELARVDGLRVVAEAVNGVELLSALETHGPNLVILEPSILGYRATEVIREVKKRNRKARFLVLAADGTAAAAQKLIFSGASGYLLKQNWKRTLLPAVAMIRSDTVVVDPGLEASLADSFKAVYLRGDAPPAVKLTKREIEALGYIVEGYSNIEIGDKMAISVRTAEKHRANILKKLDTNRTTHLIKYGLRHGLIDLYENDPVPTL